MRRLASAVLLCVLAALSVQVAAAGAAERTLWPGVTYERGVQLTPNGPVAISILRGPRPGGLTTLEPLLSNETLLGRETLTGMQRRLGSVVTTAGVNGDFFTLSTGMPSGVLMREGQLLAPPRSSRSSVGIRSDGSLDVRRVSFFGSWFGSAAVKHPFELLNAAPGDGQTALFTDAYGPTTPRIPGGTAAVLFPFPAPIPGLDLTTTVGLVLPSGAPVEIPSGGAVLVGRGTQGALIAAEAAESEPLTVRLQLRPSWPDVVGAIGGGPQIVRDGAPVFRAGEAFTSRQLGPREPRTAVGQTPDGRILLVTVDGRQPGLSVGLTNFELAQALVRLGAVTGMALDGGGSTTMAFDGGLLNRPSGLERPIATALVLAYTGVLIPPGPERVSPNGDGVDDDPRLAVRLVRPSVVTTRLVAPDGVVIEATEERMPGTVAVTLPLAGPTPAATALESTQLGTWRLEASATDDLGRASAMTRSVVLDDTLGFLRVSRRFTLRDGGPSLAVAFRLARDARVVLRVETPGGAVIRRLPAAPRSAGAQILGWNGRARNGALVASGSYVVRVLAIGPVGTSELAAPVVVRRSRG
jgi:hypothetical protein